MWWWIFSLVNTQKKVFFFLTGSLSLPLSRHRPPFLDHAFLLVGQERVTNPYERLRGRLIFACLWVSLRSHPYHLRACREQAIQSVTRADRKKIIEPPVSLTEKHLSKIHRSFVLLAHLQTEPPWLTQCLYVDDAGLEQVLLICLQVSTSKIWEKCHTYIHTNSRVAKNRLHLRETKS